ncbi:hypothetical protein OSTOST_15864 [Ostertagia ostertagi]
MIEELMSDVSRSIVPTVGESMETSENIEPPSQGEETAGEDESDLGLPRDLANEIKDTIRQRGIESCEDWKDYVSTMERDAEIRELLKTDVLQKPTYSTGQQCAGAWSAHLGSLTKTEQATPIAGEVVVQQFANYLRATTCPDQGIFKENYEDVVGCESSVVEILGDDHLSDRAKSMFMALPRAVKEQGFERVVAEMAKLLALDSTAGRLRALTELRKLRIRPNQGWNKKQSRSDNRGPVARICPNSLGQSQRLARAFPASGSAHRVEPHRAYDEVKQLALSIEQSKLMLSANRRPPNCEWRNRFTKYCGDQESESIENGWGASELDPGGATCAGEDDNERRDRGRNSTKRLWDKAVTKSRSVIIARGMGT